MKLKVYYAYILDHKGAPVMQTRFCTSSRQAAAVANQIIEKCPPAMGFNIRFKEVTIKEIAELLNGAFLFFTFSSQPVTYSKIICYENKN